MAKRKIPGQKNKSSCATSARASKKTGFVPVYHGAYMTVGGRKVLRLTAVSDGAHYVLEVRGVVAGRVTLLPWVNGKNSAVVRYVPD